MIVRAVLVGDGKGLKDRVGKRSMDIGRCTNGASAKAVAEMYPEDECHDRNADQADDSVQQGRDVFFEGILSLHVAGFRFVFHRWCGNCDKYRKAGSPGRPDLQAWTPDRSNPAGLVAATLRDSRELWRNQSLCTGAYSSIQNRLTPLKTCLCSGIRLVFRARTHPTENMLYSSKTGLRLRHILRRCFARDLFEHLVER